ncbi:inter-alpha-trypsin inhibitor domain-containing protein [Oceaniferula spumae]|uniref:Inter-alpha-trypsin inhibitor domain-containing protein n=1 Tax=Oceaniferula spumae TaxID=2979115 RepID=A0AAT9FNY0_9BACT
MIKKLNLIFLTTLLSLTALIAGEQVQGPYFQITSADSSLDSFPLKASKARVSISGTIAQVELRQTYANTGGHPIEAVYVFPGSTGSAMHGMEMKIGEKVIVAKIAERNKARAAYEKAKSENKTASLLEQQRPNVFQMNVANILPGDEVEVLLRYSEHLKSTDGQYAFVMPTVVGPRYGNGSSADSQSSDWVANPYLQPGTATSTEFEFTMDLRTGLPLKQVLCTTHSSPIKYLGKQHASLVINSSTDATCMNRDIIVRYRLADEKVESGILLHQAEEKGGENFFLVDIEPPARVKPEHIPARDYLFVLDVSGSMNGFPLETARKLLVKLADQLRPTDTFNVLLFAGNSQTLSQRPLVASEDNIEKALSFMRYHSRRGSGGTELIKALKRAVNMPGSEDKSRSIVVVTDGFVDFEADAFDLVRNSRGQANVFCFGIGSSVNRHLVEGIANAGGGEAFVVTTPSEAPDTARRFREYIESPVLTNVKLETRGFDATELQPTSISDVFANRPITVIGKWKGIAEGQLILTGITGGGENYRQVIDIADTASKGMHNPALRSLWARERVRELSDYAKLRNDPDRHSETVQEVTNLGLTYSLLTPYTSFIAVNETVRPIDEPAQTVKHASPLPKGVSAKAVPSNSVPMVKGGSVPEPGSSVLFIVSLVTLLMMRVRRCPV